VNIKALQRVPISILRELCAQTGIDLGVKKKLTKKYLVQMLTVGHLLMAFE